MLAQLALRPDVPVERHGGDPEFAAERGHGGVTVRHRSLGQPHLGFRQRERPAAVSPARVRSRISSRSNSASAAKMPNTRRPAAVVVVSICAPCPVSTRRPTPRVDRSCTVLTRVELPDDEHVARPERAHTAVESRAVVADAGREVVVDVDGVDASGLQRVALQVQRLCSRPPGSAQF